MLKSVSLLNTLLDIKVGCFITSLLIKSKYLNEQTLMKDTICGYQTKDMIIYPNLYSLYHYQILIPQNIRIH